MKGSVYQKILQAYKNMDSTRQRKFLRIYPYVPSLPQLRAIRESLAGLKRTSNRRNGLRERLSRKR